MAEEASMNNYQIFVDPEMDNMEDRSLPAPTRETGQMAKGSEQDTEEEIAEDPALRSTRTFSVILPSYDSALSSKTPNEESSRKKFHIPGRIDQASKRQRSNEYTGDDTPNFETQDKFAGFPEEKHASEKSCKRYIDYLEHQLDNSEDKAQTLQAKIEQLESEKSAVEEKHKIFVRKQQEESFKLMSTSRWMPVEDRKVIGDLDRLKRDMRSWAKKAATINDMRDIGRSLDKSSLLALKNALRSVVYFEGGTIPPALSLSKKAPGLLLNALLSHNIYATLFQSPFFFLPDCVIEGQSKRSESRLGLEKVYENSLLSNEEDAHVWRSQTLRLLLPSIVTGFSQGEERLHKMTEDSIAEAADQEASKFLAGAARHLIADVFRDKIYAIHREAATTSYNIWTRRTVLKGWTLKGLGFPTFDPDNKYMTSHSSVDYENYDDQLKGRSISVIMHPIVAVYGTDEGKDYDQERVWAPAEVWFDTRAPSARSSVK